MASSLAGSLHSDSQGLNRGHSRKPLPAPQSLAGTEKASTCGGICGQEAGWQHLFLVLETSLAWCPATPSWAFEPGMVNFTQSHPLVVHKTVDQRIERDPRERLVKQASWSNIC